MSHNAQRFLGAVVCLILCACGGGGGGDEQPTPPKQGSLAIADVDTDDDGLIEIATLEHLDWVRNDFAGTSFKDNAGRVNSSGCRAGGCNGYELTADLDFDTNGDGMMDGRDAYFDYDRNGSNAGWLPIIRLFGNFEGNGRRILSLFINRPNTDNVGLFEIVDSAAGASVVIRNVEFSGPLTSITGRNSVGALVGWAVVSGSMQMDSNRVSGRVTGRGSNTGGLVGEFSITGGQLTVRDNQSSASVEGVAHGTGGLIGRVIDVSSNPGVVAISGNTAAGPVNSTETSGGLLGVASADITIENCSSSSAVTGVEAGGLIGMAAGSRFTLRNSQSTGDVARSPTSVSNIASTSGGLIANLYARQVTIADVRVTADAVSGNTAGGLVGTARLSHGTLDIRNAFADVGVVGGEPSYAVGAIDAANGMLSFAGGWRVRPVRIQLPTLHSRTVTGLRTLQDSTIRTV